MSARTSPAPRGVRMRHSLQLLDGSGSDLEVRIAAPNEWDARQPVLCIDKFSSTGEFFRLHQADPRGKLRPRDFPTDGRRSDPHFRIVADSLYLARFAVRHHIEMSVVFAKPHRRVDG